MKIEDIKQCFCGGNIVQKDIYNPYKFNCYKCRNYLCIESDANEDLFYFGYIIGADIYSVYVANIDNTIYRFRFNETHIDYKSFEEAFERMKASISYRCLD
jgi:hypothetical protein